MKAQHILAALLIALTTAPVATAEGLNIAGIAIDVPFASTIADTAAAVDATVPDLENPLVPSNDVALPVIPRQEPPPIFPIVLPDGQVVVCDEDTIPPNVTVQFPPNGEPLIIPASDSGDGLTIPRVSFHIAGQTADTGQAFPLLDPGMTLITGTSVLVKVCV